MVIGEWVGLGPFSSIQETILVVRSNYGTSPFRYGLHSTERRLIGYSERAVMIPR